MKTIKMRCCTYTYNDDQTLTITDDRVIDKEKKTFVIPKEDLQTMSDHYKGVNRIYKPMALLFWQDCKNGKSSNWE